MSDDTKKPDTAGNETEVKVSIPGKPTTTPAAAPAVAKVDNVTLHVLSVAWTVIKSETRWTGNFGKAADKDNADTPILAVMKQKDQTAKPWGMTVFNIADVAHVLRWSLEGALALGFHCAGITGISDPRKAAIRKLVYDKLKELGDDGKALVHEPIVKALTALIEAEEKKGALVEDLKLPQMPADAEPYPEAVLVAATTVAPIAPLAEDQGGGDNQKKQTVRIALPPKGSGSGITLSPGNAAQTQRIEMPPKGASSAGGLTIRKPARKFRRGTKHTGGAVRQPASLFNFNKTTITRTIVRC